MPMFAPRPLGQLLAWLLATGLGGSAASAAAQGDPDPQIDAIMDGIWEFSTTGTTPGMSSRPQDYSQVRRVHFQNGAFDTNPLGFISQGFRLTTCELDGPVAFETPYTIGGGNYDMTFKGVGDFNLTHLSGGFEFCMASGTFTAIHEAAEARQTLITMPFGATAACPISLTLKPDGPVTVKIARERGDAHLELTPQTLTFTADTWDQSQDVTIDATAVTHPGQVVLAISGPGVPETEVWIKLVRPAVTHP